MKLTYQILFSICLLLVLGYIYSYIFPPKNIYRNIGGIINSILPIITLFVLLFTLRTYIELNDTGKETLSFTRRQSTYTNYFDNYKLFNELSKKKIGVVYSSERLSEKSKELFDNLSFDNIYLSYKKIIENYTELVTNENDQPNKEREIFRDVFFRFHYKIMAFANIINMELLELIDNRDLIDNQKASLISLYENFILTDYMNLGSEIVTELDNPDEEKFLTRDLLKCFYETDIDYNEFLSLHSLIMRYNIDYSLRNVK